MKDKPLRKFPAAIGLACLSMVFTPAPAMATTEPPSEPDPADPELGTGPSGTGGTLPICPINTAYTVEGEFFSEECQPLALPVPSTTPATILLSNQGCDVPAGTELEGHFTSPDQMGELLECWIPELEEWLAQEFAGQAPPTPNGYLFIPPTATNEDRSAGCDYHDADMFYCPQDSRIYLGAAAIWDLYSSYGDLVPVVVLAHEAGHFLQHYSGAPFADMEISPTEEIPYENQSDCTAGVFLDYVNHRGGLTTGDQGVEDDIVDLAQGMRALASYESGGDQRTHGTMDQRMRSFYTGYLGNEGLNACNVFITDFTVFPTTGVEVVPPVDEEPTVPAPAPTIQPSGLGTDASLNALAQSCYDGNMDACDNLYEAAREVAGAQAYVSFADTCAGRQAADSGVWCRDAFINTATTGPTTTVVSGVTTTVPAGPTTTVAGGLIGDDSTGFVWVVGTDVQPGTYTGQSVVAEGGGCYWARLNTVVQVAANEVPPREAIIEAEFVEQDGSVTVEILPADVAFFSWDCQPWTPAVPVTVTTLAPGTTLVPSTTVPGTPATEHLSPITVLMVGTDIQAGEYRANITMEGGRPCIWIILNSIDYVGDIPPEAVRIAGGVIEEVGIYTVSIEPTDVALWSVDCGEWTPVTPS